MQKIDEAAVMWNKTKDPNNTDRRIVSFNNRRKRNVQGFNYSRKSYVNLL